MRPSNLTPILDFVADLEAGSRCNALVGDFLAGLSELLLLRMVARLGEAPPVFSVGEGFCPLGGGPLRCHASGAARASPDKTSRNATKEEIEAEARERWDACRRSAPATSLPTVE